MNFFSKTIIFLIIFLLIFNSSGYSNKSGFLNLTPNKAEAAWWSTVFYQIIEYAEKKWEKIEINWQKMMRDIIAKRIMDYIVDQTITWIQGGGEPKFISNWDGFLKDAKGLAIDSVIKEVGLAPLCSPFKLQVQLSLLPVQRFPQRITCTLDDIVENIEDFYADFENGGWIAYNKAWEPQNNYFGMILLAQDEMMVRSEAKVTASQNEARASGGFLGVKRCLSTTADKSKWIGECMDSPGWVDESTAFETCSKNVESVNIPCSKEETTTPGAVVGQAVGNAVTSDTQWAANISSWVSALANALINRLLTEGISSIKKSDPNAPPDYYPPEYGNIRASYYEQDKERMIAEVRRAAGNSVGVDTSSITQETLIYANSTLAMLQEMQSLGCSVNANEIAAAQSEVDNLLAQSENQGSEADLLINDIQATDPSDTDAWASILDRYNAFMVQDKQNLDNIQNNSGGDTYDPQGNANAKLTAAINENNAVLARLATCKSPILINNNDATTANSFVTLKLNSSASASGVDNATEMFVSNDSNFVIGNWESYSSTKSWTLDINSASAVKTVYVKFRNASNVVSNIFSDDITLQ